MNIITGRVTNEHSVRGYVWYDSTVPLNGYRFKWSLTYNMIPEPKIFSEEYKAMYPEEFYESTILERILIFFKLKQNEQKNLRK